MEGRVKRGQMLPGETGWVYLDPPEYLQNISEYPHERSNHISYRHVNLPLAEVKLYFGRWND